jgi:hypothetical protein
MARTMFIDMRLPEQFAVPGVNGIHVRQLTGEQGNLLRSYRDCGSHVRLWFENPINAAGLRVQRIDFARGATDKYAFTGDGRLREGDGRAGKTKGPLQHQLGRVDARLCEAVIVDAVAPAGPGIIVYFKRCGAVLAHARCGGRAPDGLACQPFSQ